MPKSSTFTKTKDQNVKGMLDEIRSDIEHRISQRTRAFMATQILQGLVSSGHFTDIIEDNKGKRPEVHKLAVVTALALTDALIEKTQLIVSPEFPSE